MDSNETVMQVDCTKVLKDLDGTTLKNGDKKSDDLTVGSIMKQACLLPLQIDADKGGTEKFELFCLAKKIHDAEMLDLRRFEVDILKDRIGKGFTVLIVGQMMEILG